MAIFNNREFYQDAVLKHGVSPKGVHWRSYHTQEKRFQILLKLIKKDIKNSSIIDAGCGFGDLVKYFINHNQVPKSYLGIDVEDFFVELARTIYPNTSFAKYDILKDDLPQADYYLCSGAMNTLELHEMKIFIKRCFENSNKGFIFNFLISNSFNGVEKGEVLEYCNSLTNQIKTRDNYLDDDFTIFMVK